MGGGCSNAQRYVQPDWNMPGDYIKIKNKYISCNLVTANCSVTELELCVVLNDTIGLRHLTKFSETVNKNGLIECWNDIIDYDTSSNFRRERLNKICSNYRNLSYLLENIPNQFENGLQKLQNIGTLLPEVVPVVMKEIFENARVYCFKNIHSLLWLDFMQLEAYHSMVEMMLSAAHHTSPDDFEYLNKIAEGGFGLVLHCRKKDTGVCYAMKVQPKAALLKFFRRKPGRVIGEMQAYAVFRHPYIAKLSYAFQTPTLAIMVMPVCACGDLRKSASLTSCGRMALARVKFYSAEIVSALKYLHSHGILYRDLKPANVLLNSDGHIMLADFGSLADVGDKIGSTFKEKQAQLHSKASNGTIINGAIIEGDDRSYSMSTSNSNPPGKFLVSSTSAPDEAQVVPESNSVGKSCAHPASNPNSNPRSNSNANSALTTHEEEDTPKPQPEIESKPEVEPAPEVEPVSERDASRVKFDVSTKDGNLPLVSLKNRSSSLVGTLAYMAPEILIMFGKKRLNKDGYTDAVDWWSLGVTVYKLLTGYEPYRSMSYDRLRAIFPSILAKYNNYYSAFVSVFGKVNYFESEDILDADTINFIKRLLEFDSEKRLGAGNNGSDVDGHGALMSHPFFDGIDWEKLEKKQVQPPYIPEYETMEVLKESTPRRGTGAVLSDDSMSAPSDSVSCSVSVHRQPLMFNEMLKSCNKGAWIACGDNSSLKHALTTSGKKASAKGDQNSASMASGALSKRFWYFGNMSLSVTKHSSSVSNSKGGGKDLNKGENPAQYFVSESDQDYFKDWEFVAPELAITSQGSDYKSMSRSGKKTKTSDYSSTSTSSRNKEKSVRM